MGLATIDPHSYEVQIQRPDAIHFFVNFDVFKSLYFSQN